MRTLVTLIAAGVLAGSAAGPSLVADRQHVQDLLTGILQDVGAILNSFTGGPDDPKSPVTNRSTLQQDVAYLDAASQQAQELANELNRPENGSNGRGR